MLCYFISKKDFKILNCVEVNSYSIAHNIDCGGKSKIIIADDPKAADEDFVILKDGKNIKFKGIIENIDNSNGEKNILFRAWKSNEFLIAKSFLRIRIS